MITLSAVVARELNIATVEVDGVVLKIVEGMFVDGHPPTELIPEDDLATCTLLCNAEKAEYAAQEYARNRLTAYNALNQMELISDDSINGTTTHKDAILAIKAEFPKP